MCNLGNFHGIKIQENGMEKIELKLTTANLKKRQLTKSRQYLSEVNIEQLCFNMKTARYNRVEMKRIIQ